MYLTDKQISNIDTIIEIESGRLIVLIDVTGEKDISDKNNRQNLYCVTKSYEIIWQVKESNSTNDMNDDLFIYLRLATDGQIIADKWSGYQYSVNKLTGEVNCIGFNK